LYRNGIGLAAIIFLVFLLAATNKSRAARVNSSLFPIARRGHKFNNWAYFAEKNPVLTTLNRFTYGFFSFAIGASAGMAIYFSS
jgi:hypothetical protein